MSSIPEEAVGLERVEKMRLADLVWRESEAGA